MAQSDKIRLKSFKRAVPMVPLLLMLFGLSFPQEVRANPREALAKFVVFLAKRVEGMPAGHLLSVNRSYLQRYGLGALEETLASGVSKSTAAELRRILTPILKKGDVEALHQFLRGHQFSTTHDDFLNIPLDEISMDSLTSASDESLMSMSEEGVSDAGSLPDLPDQRGAHSQRVQERSPTIVSAKADALGELLKKIVPEEGELLKKYDPATLLYFLLVRDEVTIKGANLFFQELEKNAPLREEANRLIQENSRLYKAAKRGLDFFHAFQNLLRASFSGENYDWMTIPFKVALRSLDHFLRASESKAFQEKPLRDEQISANAWLAQVY